uniref:Eosinophil peroxidase n=1 Tax=Calidris pygmaea TaxID=425635 RepID=A0A8C3PKD7_9CHAR
ACFCFGGALVSVLGVKDCVWSIQLRSELLTACVTASPAPGLAEPLPRAPSAAGAWRGRGWTTLVLSLGVPPQGVGFAQDFRVVSGIKEHLQNDALTPVELLGYFKQPAAGVRAAIRAADYLESTLTFLTEKLVLCCYLADLLTLPQLGMIFKATGCDQQDKKIDCDVSRFYQRIAGECNSRRNPSLGASNRALPAEYEDVVSLPCGWTEGKCFSGFLFPLVIFVPQLRMDQQRSLMFTQWGQFIDHDLDFSLDTAARVTFSGKVHCDTSCVKQPPCFPIEVQSHPGNPQIKNPRDCLLFFHSAPACTSRTYFLTSLAFLQVGWVLRALNLKYRVNTFTSPGSFLCLIFLFNDFLPLLLGSGFQRLILLYQGCNESVGPQVFNIFTLAFPIAHTSVPPTVDCLNQNYKPIDPKILLRNTSFAVWRIVKEGGIDLFLWILMANQAKLMTQQPMVVDELWDQMFEKVERTGFDLPTLNLQLSRDRGLSGYNSWRQFCGISQPSVLETLAQVLRNHGLAENVMQLYGTTKNIDIWIGALAESFVNGGRVGPLMTCLIGIQFRNALDGDRFWWFFTSQQRSSLAQTFLSQIMCDSTHISEVPRLTFKANKYPFGFVSCKLSTWKKAILSSFFALSLECLRHHLV